MKTTSCRLAYIATAALLLAAGSVTAASPVGPQIDPSSCGGIAVPPSGNAFCSFEGTGDGAVIANNSCNVEGACLLMGNGVRIGHDSCNGESACTDAGTLNGVPTSATSIIGNRSCNGLEACESAGSQGLSVIGDDSCNGGANACTGAGEEAGTSYIGNSACNNTGIGGNHNTCLFVGAVGHSVIGNGSCNGSSACIFGGEFGGSSSIGNNSCNELGACFDVGQGPFPGTGDFQSASAIGNGSCNADSACEFSGIDGSSAIGNHSCNGGPDLTDPDFPVGVCDSNGSINSNGSVIGNNENNEP